LASLPIMVSFTGTIAGAIAIITSLTAWDSRSKLTKVRNVLQAVEQQRDVALTSKEDMEVKYETARCMWSGDGLTEAEDEPGEESLRKGNMPEVKPRHVTWKKDLMLVKQGAQNPSMYRGKQIRKWVPVVLTTLLAIAVGIGLLCKTLSLRSSQVSVHNSGTNGIANNQDLGMLRQTTPLLQAQGYEEAAKHFSSLTIRKLSELSDCQHICSIVYHGDGNRQVPAVRMLRAIGFAIGAILNIANIAMQFVRSIPAQRELAERTRNGDAASDYLACFSASEIAKNPCSRTNSDLHTLFVTILVWIEGVMILIAISASCWGFSTWFSCCEDDDANKAKKWISIASGFDWLSVIPSTSTLKVLPRVRSMPMEAIKQTRLKQRKLLEDDGIFSCTDRLQAWGYMLMLFLRIFIVTPCGMFALHLKMESLTSLYDIPILHWDRRCWIPFVGFVNQISGLVPVPDVKKEALLFFLFTGEDAEMQPSEEDAMAEFKGILYMRIFNACNSGLGGLVACLSLSSEDVQKIVLKETKETQETTQ